MHHKVTAAPMEPIISPATWGAAIAGRATPLHDKTDQATAFGPRSALAVVAHLEAQRAVVHATRDRRMLRAGVFRDVGQRLRHDEVGGGLDLFGQTGSRYIDLDRNGHP